MTSYVVGFAFDDKFENVLLIEKRRPEWQNGKLNGIGGHIESGEKKSEAMCREFEEESGIKTFWQRWNPLIRLYSYSLDWEVYFYWTRVNINLARSITDEQVHIIPINELFYDYKDKVIPNLLWLIPMAIDQTLKDNFTTFE